MLDRFPATTIGFIVYGFVVYSAFFFANRGFVGCEGSCRQYYVSTICRQRREKLCEFVGFCFFREVNEISLSFFFLENHCWSQREQESINRSIGQENRVEINKQPNKANIKYDYWSQPHGGPLGDQDDGDDDGSNDVGRDVVSAPQS